MAFAKAYQILDDLDDWQDDQKMGRLNAVSVLQRQLGCAVDHALARAGSLAHDFLDAAATNAGAMPQNSGSMIVAYSERMKTKNPNRVSSMKKAVVIGGGFGGIAAALRARAKGYDVTLVDRCERLGGSA